MEPKPTFIQGSYQFKGQGIDDPVTLFGASYSVPKNRSAQLVYFRAGQSAPDTINLILYRNDDVMRMFPLGIKSAMHFPLAIQEKIEGGTELSLKVAANPGLSGSVFVDLGFLEHPT